MAPWFDSFIFGAANSVTTNVGGEHPNINATNSGVRLDFLFSSEHSDNAHSSTNAGFTFIEGSPPGRRGHLAAVRC